MRERRKKKQTEKHVHSPESRVPNDFNGFIFLF